MQKDMSYLRKKMQQKESLHLLQRIMRCIKYVFRVKVSQLKHLSQLIWWVITGLLFVIFFVGKAGTGMDREVSLVLKHGAEAKDYDKVLKKLNRADIKTVLPIGSN